MALAASAVGLTAPGGVLAAPAFVVTEIPNPEPAEGVHFGRGPAGLGDLDGDGVGEIAVTSLGLGVVWVLSGTDGALVYRLTDPEDHTDQPCEPSPANGGNVCNFGMVVANVHDVDQDGIDDFAIGAPGPIGSLVTPCVEPHQPPPPPGEPPPPPPEPRCNNAERGRVLVYSGATGALMRRIGHIAFETPSQWGVSVVGLGDVDGDGLTEISVGSLGNPNSGGAVTLISIAAEGGEVQWTAWPHREEPYYDAFGNLQISIGDVTDDGWPELLVSSDEKLVYVLSGVNGDVLRIHEDPHDHGDSRANYGYENAALGDLDGDARSEYVVAHPGDASEAESFLHVFDGLDGHLVDTLSSPTDAPGSSLTLLGNGDYDDDGLPDLWVGNPRNDSATLITAAGDAITTIAGPVPDSGFGGSFAAVGPLWPGPPDLVVTAVSQTVDGFAGAGSIYVYRRDRPPECTGATVDPALIWTPSGDFVDLTISGIEDPESSPIAITVTSIRQDEPVETDVDGLGVGTSTASVRAQRAGSGDGRVYHIGFDASDEAGGTCSGTVQVVVPHDQRGLPAGDGGPVHDSTAL